MLCPGTARIDLAGNMAWPLTNETDVGLGGRSGNRGRDTPGGPLMNSLVTVQVGLGEGKTENFGTTALH